MPKKNPLNSGKAKPKGMPILSESGRDVGSVQRLTAQAERRRLGTLTCKYGGVNIMKRFVSKSERICVFCQSIFSPNSSRQLTCSAECRTEYMKKCALERIRAKENGTFIPKMESSGIGLYRKMLSHVKKCQRCGSKRFLVTHHKDGNRKNNDISNLEKICKRCHQLDHGCYGNLPPPSEVGKMRSKFIKRNKGIRDDKGRFIKVRKV